MNRVIKFRAKRDSDINKDWVYGVPVPNFADEGWLLTSEGTCIHVEVNTLCEYTGVSDENDVEIYEGDIVYCYSNSFRMPMGNMVVIFVGGSFRLVPYYDYLHPGEQKMVSDYPVWRFVKTVKGNIFNAEET